MSDKKLTDSEIVKALKQCSDCNADLRKSCNGCLLLNYFPYCTENGIDLGVDLINHLQAENERLKEEKSKLENKIDEIYPLVMQLPNAMQQAKAESYKECIDKVKNIICENTYPDFDKNGKAVNIWKSRAYKDIDNLLKELVGENNETRCVSVELYRQNFRVDCSKI